MKRPDYVKCVTHTHDGRKGESWCGRVGSEWFESIDSAAYAQLNGSLLLICPECRKAIIEAMNVQEN